MYQRTTLVGFLGRDPEMRYTSEGTPCTGFSMATTDKRKRNDATVEKVVWWNVTTWGPVAEIANKYLEKGSLVLVEGIVKADDSGNPRIWFTRDGNEPRSNFEITANILRILRGKARQETEERNDDEDSIPF